VYAPSMRIALSLVAIIVLSGIGASAARAQTATYESRVRQAAVQVATGDRAAGLALLRTAVADSPSRPDAICYLAEAYRVSGDFVAALDNFEACLRVARTAGNAAFTARAMHGVASTFERMPEHLADARAAWLEYARFADGATSVASAQIGRERVTAVDVVTEQERVYVEVRQRIAERERVAATPAP
jgi:hypothetical protein